MSEQLTTDSIVTKRQLVIYVGIDPGETCGFSIWNRNKKKFDRLASYQVWEAMAQLNQIRDLYHPDTKFYVIIEDPGQNRPVFPLKEEKQMIQSAMGLYKSNPVKALKDLDSFLRRFGKRAQNVGMNKNTAKMVIQYAKRLGFNVQEYKPTKGKLDATTFKVMTGLPNGYNEHIRDSAMLIFGK